MSTWLWTLAIFWGSTAVGLAQDASASSASGRAWRVEDSIGVRYFVAEQRHAGSLDASLLKGDPIVVSPGGRYFFFVSYRGILECDCVEYELQVFEAAPIRKLLASRRSGVSRPLRVISQRSARSEADYEAIRDARWLDDRTILFVGVKDAGKRQFFRLDVRSGALEQLTDDRFDVQTIEMVGDTVAYFSLDGTPKTLLDRYPAVTVLDNDLEGLFRGVEPDFTLVTRQAGSKPWAALSFRNFRYGPWISPDGNWVTVAVAPRGSTPSHWQAYDRGMREPTRFMLLDVRKRQARPVFDAPSGAATLAGMHTPPLAFWSADSTRLLLVSTALPLDTEHPERASTAYIVDYEVETGRATPIMKLAGPGEGSVGRVRGEWLTTGKRLHLSLTSSANRGAVRSFEFEHRAEGWVSRPASPNPRPALNPMSASAPVPPVLGGGLSVTVRQSANDPPAVIASYRGRELALTPPDAALEGVHFSRMEAVEWDEPSGERSRGGLILPKGYVPGSRVPLVIQAYYYEPRLFWPDGSATTAYAAQALASRGMAVLFMNIPSAEKSAATGTPQEGAVLVARVDAAVEELSRRGIVDASRVGLIGFSRGGFMTYYAITHPGRTRLAAAVVADGWTASYGEYIVDAATAPESGRISSSFEQMQGGNHGPFWGNPQAWLEFAPGFNVHRVRTPALFTMNSGTAGNLLILETIAAFRINRKPFEYVSFPKGTHQLRRPRQRYESMRASVDWMGFWLLGQVDEGERRPQFDRWRTMQRQWNERESSASEH